MEEEGGNKETHTHINTYINDQGEIIAPTKYYYILSKIHNDRGTFKNFGDKKGAKGLQDLGREVDSLIFAPMELSHRFDSRNSMGTTK